MAITSLAGKWALVTGASSGLGVEFATSLAEQQANLVLVARRTDRLTQLGERLESRYPVQTAVEGVDLSAPGAGAALKRRLDARGIDVDILVNNAGYGLYGSLVDQPLERTLDMLQLNIVAWLQENARTMDILEPLDRITAALNSICGEGKRG